MKEQQKFNLPRGKSSLYKYCRKFISIILTLIILVPIIFILGSEQTQFYDQKSYKYASTLLSYGAKAEEIQQIFKKESIVNAYYHDGESKEGQNDSIHWQNIRQFSQYLGYRLNNKGNIIIRRVIDPLEIKKSKGRSKNDQNKIQKAYEFTYFGEINILKNKLKAVLLKNFKKIKTKDQLSKQSNFITRTYIKSINYLHKNNVWLLIINPNLVQYYQSNNLIKQIKKILQTSPLDRFIILSKYQDKDLKNVYLSLNKSEVKNYQSTILKSMIAQHKVQLQFKSLQKIIVCNYQNSIVQFHKFYERFTSYSDVFKKMLNKKSLNKQSLKILKNICTKGVVQKSKQIQKVLLDLKIPLNADKNQIATFLSIFYQTVYGISCKINSKCQQKQIKLQEQASQKFNDIQLNENHDDFGQKDKQNTSKTITEKKSQNIEKNTPSQKQQSKKQQKKQLKKQQKTGNKKNKQISNNKNKIKNQNQNKNKQTIENIKKNKKKIKKNIPEQKIIQDDEQIKLNNDNKQQDLNNRQLNEQKVIQNNNNDNKNQQIQQIKQNNQIIQVNQQPSIVNQEQQKDQGQLNDKIQDLPIQQSVQQVNGESQNKNIQTTSQKAEDQQQTIQKAKAIQDQETNNVQRSDGQQQHTNEGSDPQVEPDNIETPALNVQTQTVKEQQHVPQSHTNIPSSDQQQKPNMADDSLQPRSIQDKDDKQENENEKDVEPQEEVQQSKQIIESQNENEEQ